MASMKVPPQARAGQVGRGHRFAADPQRWAPGGETPHRLAACQFPPLVVPLEECLEVRQMTKVPDIVPISDLRQDAAAVLQRARSKRSPVFITQRGRATAVLVPLEEYERDANDRHILLLLARGEKEIAAGRGHDLDSVLAEADELLARVEP